MKSFKINRDFVSQFLRNIHNMLQSIQFKLTLIIGISMMLIFLGVIYLIDRGITEHFEQQDREQLLSLANTVANNQQRMHQKMTANILHQAVNMHQTVFAFTLSGRSSLTSSNPTLAEQLELTPFLQDEFTPKSSTLSAQFVKTFGQVTNQSLAEIALEPRLVIWEIDHRSYRVLFLPTYLAFDDNQSVHRMHSTQNPDASNVFGVLVGMDIEFHHHYLKGLHKQLLQLSLLASLLIMLIAYFFIRIAHRPIANISATFDQIATGKLTTRISVDGYPTELHPMIGAFNRMMSNLDELFTEQANFSADIAHELRTPMTNLMTQTQIILSQSRHQQEYQELLFANLEEFERLTKMINDMLYLANMTHLEHTQNLPEKRLLSLQQELLDVIDYFDAWAEERGIKIELVIVPADLGGEALMILGEKTMLRRAFSNLLANAIRYSPKDSVINIHLSKEKEKEKEKENERIIIKFTNTLITEITASQLEKLFDRFYRVDSSRTHNKVASGAGIGLSIVKSILKAHNATISVSTTEQQIHLLLQFKPITKPLLQLKSDPEK